MTETTSCRPSSRRGPTTRARLIFAAATARAGVMRAARRAGEGRPGRGPRPGCSRACRARRGRQPPVRGRRDPLAPASWRASCAGGRTPPGPDAEPTRARRPRVAAGGRPRAPSRRWAAAGSTSARPGGRPFARWQVAGRHRDRAVVLRPRPGEEAVGDLALDHDAPALDGRARGEALDDEWGGDVVRQIGDELRRRRVERRGQRSSASPKTSSTFVRAPTRSRRTGSRLRSSSIACTRRTRAARYSVSTPRPGPISRTTSSGPSAAIRPITWRMFSSTSQCCPSSRFGRALTGGRRGRRRWPRSALPGPRRRRHAPPPGQRACA